jgi:hypothetical protein
MMVFRPEAPCRLELGKFGISMLASIRQFAGELAP